MSFVEGNTYTIRAYVTEPDLYHGEDIRQGDCILFGDDGDSKDGNVPKVISDKNTHAIQIRQL